MGYYINPGDGTDKEEFLANHAVMVGHTTLDALHHFMAHTSDVLPVVLLDNGVFTAAGIAYNKAELDVFLDPTDDRHRMVFLISKATLIEAGQIFPEDEPWTTLQ